jgi:hypothetical protein
MFAYLENAQALVANSAATKQFLNKERDFSGTIQRSCS